MRHRYRAITRNARSIEGLVATPGPAAGCRSLRSSCLFLLACVDGLDEAELASDIPEQAQYRWQRGLVGMQAGEDSAIPPSVYGDRTEASAKLLSHRLRQHATDLYQVIQCHGSSSTAPTVPLKGVGPHHPPGNPPRVEEARSGRGESLRLRMGGSRHAVRNPPDRPVAQRNDPIDQP